jgi:hypothetical protein
MTAAVVNHLHFKEPLNPEPFWTAERDLTPQMKEIEGFRAFHPGGVAPPFISVRRMTKGRTPWVSPVVFGRVEG